MRRMTRPPSRPGGLRALLLVIVLSMAPSCGENEGSPVILPEAGSSCGPGRCNGCCEGDRCQAGTDNNACGGVGMPCVQCQTGEVCVQGQCLTTSGKCNPGNCPTGCCQGDNCLAGTDNAACGTGGIPCIACAASQTCENQSCGCGPSTCNGCCDGAGVCRSGTEPGACGTGGKACALCIGPDSCVLGSCTSSSCNASSCATGCCSGSTCKAGTDTADCGQGGQTCKACNTGESCVQSVCVNTSQCGPGSCNGCCQGSQCLSGLSTTACGTGGDPCQICSSKALCTSGSCSLDPLSKWGIVMQDASIDTSKNWDTLVYTAPDPYVKVTVGTLSGTTTPINDTYTPKWDEYLFSATAASITGSGLSVEIYDDDWPTADELMGACNVTVSDTALMAGGGYISSCGADGNILKLSFKFTN